MSRHWMYHKDYAPKGKIFNFAEPGPSQQDLVKQGWVDNPAKIGIDLWAELEGMSEEDRARRAPSIRQIESDFDTGKLKAVEETPGVIPERLQDDAQRAMRERDDAFKALRVQEEENEALKRELREARQKEADLHSDAEKVMEKPIPKGSVQVLSPEPEPKPAKAKRSKQNAASETEL